MGGTKGAGATKTGLSATPRLPPSTCPRITGAEKAERQLLRALFSPEWRVYILSNMQPACS